MSDIPTEAYLEVLKRLPVETLFQVRSVCKSWRRIIDDPNFAKLHISRGIGDGWIVQRNNTGKLFLSALRHLIIHKQFLSDCTCDYANMQTCMECCIEWINATNTKYPVGPGLPRIRNLPVPCCNGLILISSIKPNMVWVIWNPFTGESVKLPFCDEFPKDVKIDTGFDDPYCGIGYDDVNDDYKVVRIVKPYSTFICSVNSGAWRRIEDFPRGSDRPLTYEDFPHDFIGPYTKFGAYANGALHWIAYTADKRGWIVALDLTTETYRKIPVPEEIGVVGNPAFLKLVELSGCLFLISWHLRELLVVWMIRDYHDRCTERMWVRIMSLKQKGEFIGGLKPIAYLKNENRVLLWHKSEIFSWYDVQKKFSREVSMEVNPDANGDDHDSDSLRYIYDTFTSQVIPASLVRLKKCDTTDEGVASKGKSSKRKRKRVPEPETLGMKVFYGSPDDW